jgi:hypothetical protein
VRYPSLSLGFALALLITQAASINAEDYSRDLFNTGAISDGTQPSPSYDPLRLSELYGKRHAIELQMFDLINEAAVRRDKSMKKWLDLYGESLGYIPTLAAAHYKWVFGDKSQLDWLLAEDEKRGLGTDSPVLIVFGYMDEWDRTIRRLKEHEEFNEKHEGGGAPGAMVARAIEIRKRLYGAERFNKVWENVKVN